ncbi:hypothetical protein GCM10017653_38870 [Ancylobacter defluvii]|uniref:Uncharacterized protein n=1 Tax=Ancylobacter defluvii TaxID=1282440 RepID=A0A9W6JZ50_9HYPH|nr:hypothetical protein GCM10017653_38870 [Ancylobacter defluvii]
MAGPCQRHRAAGALEQAHAERVLEQLDLPTERWLGEIEAHGCAAEMEFFGDGNKAAEMAKLEHRSKNGINRCQEQFIVASNVT